jgi:hypothetical protein
MINGAIGVAAGERCMTWGGEPSCYQASSAAAVFMMGAVAAGVSGEYP